MGFPMPEVWPHVVTVGESMGIIISGSGEGNPIILRGMTEGAQDWNQISYTFRDVLIYTCLFIRGAFPGMT